MFKETIVLASNINETEKLKSLAAFSKSTFAVRYMSTLDLARYLLQLSGVSIKETFIKDDDLAASLYNKAKAIPYFSKFTFNDVLHLVNSLADIRRLITDDESKAIHEKLKQGSFKAKNEAIISFYEILDKYLKDNNLIDEVNTIRYAYQNTKVFPNIDFVIYEGDKLLDYSLDIALLKKASGKEVKPAKIFDGKISITSYTKAFSQVNEIENILDYIYKNKIPFDQCLIASSDSSDYPLIIQNYCDLLKFPLTIATGQILINTNPGKLFSTIGDFLNNKCHHTYLRNIIFDESFNLEKFKEDLELPESFDELNQGVKRQYWVNFDSIIQTVGDLKLSLDTILDYEKVKEDNNQKVLNYFNLIEEYMNHAVYPEDTARRIKEMKYVRRFKEIFNKGLLSFLNEYSKVNNDADQNALDKIAKCFAYSKENNISFEEIYKTIFAQKVGRKSPEPGSLYFTSISNASSSLRKHLFIVGLSSKLFPGNAKEDFIFLDEDYASFGLKDKSYRNIDNNKNAYFALLKHASTLDVDIHLSYAYYDSITLKNANASSVILETFKEEYGEDKTLSDIDNAFLDDKNLKFKKVEYFSNKLINIADIGQKLINNEEVSFTHKELGSEEGVPLSDEIKNRSLSASAILNYVKCPYLFYLSNILGIPQPEDTDIYELIPANDYGSLAHALLEDLDKKTTPEEDFLELCKKRFDEYFIMHYTDNVPLKEKIKEEFVEMMKNAYQMDGCYEKVIAEKDFYIDHSCGLSIHGYPDAVIKKSNGKYHIIDYKTGRSITHDEAKPETLLQLITYAYILSNQEKNPLDVESFEFQYIRLNRRVDSNRPMQEYYDVLDLYLKQIKESYETGVFNTCENGKVCEKCYFKDVCTRKKQ